MQLLNKVNKGEKLTEPAAKRISTPAGQRLSVITEQRNARANRASMRGALGDAPQEDSEQQSNSSGAYSWSVWSDGEKFAIFRGTEQMTGKRRWKRIVLIVAMIICAIIALSVGLAVGLKKKGSSVNESDSQAEAAEASNTAIPASPNTAPTPTGTLAPPSSHPTNFPVGSYSMVTFLDTIQTNCTSNPATWTCHPNTVFYEDPSEAVATFNWIISSPSKDKFQISSKGDNPFGIEFTNQELELLDQGKDAERYRFQLSTTKTVKPEKSITEDGQEAECEFVGTSLQAYLYTKMARSYPDTDKGQPSGDPEFDVWPYAVRIEQAVGGGQNVPRCRTTPSGDEITKGLKAEDASGLCSCLYKNWNTPSIL